MRLGLRSIGILLESVSECEDAAALLTTNERTANDNTHTLVHETRTRLDLAGSREFGRCIEEVSLVE